MNAPARAEILAAAEATGLEFSPRDRQLLAMAAHVAGGMAANPEVYVGQDYEGTIARASYRIAQKIMTLHVTGGC